jgi:ankyrin repeat protein
VSDLSPPALYVHVANDGGLLTVDGQDGRSAWVTLADLRLRLARLREQDGALLLSSDLDPPTPVAATAFDAIAEAGVPMESATAVHPDAVRQGGSTALMSAVFVGAEGLARDLIERGVDLDATDVDGYTALMYAANAGDVGLVSMLVDAGADLDRADRQGSTPLMFAAQNGSFAVVRRLLAGGADVRRRGQHGLCASDFARQGGHDKVAAVLMTAEQQPS